MAGWLRRLLGDRGERAAEQYLTGQGMRILARGLRSRRGELDIVADRKSTRLNSSHRL